MFLFQRFKGLDKDGRKKRKLGEENQKRRGRKPLHLNDNKRYYFSITYASIFMFII